MGSPSLPGLISEALEAATEKNIAECHAENLIAMHEVAMEGV